MSTNMLNFIAQLHKKNLLAYLQGKISGEVWDKARKSLLDYNQSIITLSSSALVLSFTLIKITNLDLNKKLVGLSWMFYLLAILLGSSILFVNFLYNLTDGIVERESKEGKYKKLESIVKHREIKFYFLSRSLIFLFATSELIFFWLGFVFLIFAAYLSL